MNVMLDIFGASFIAGMLLLLMLKLNLFTSQASFSSDNELRMQQNAKTLAEIMNYDFRKIGYNFDGTAILSAEEKRIKFVADLEAPDSTGFGIIDTVEYFIADPGGTSNPDEIVLIRVLNNKDSIAGPSLGLVKLQFSYEDSVGTITTDLEKIKYIQTELWVEPVNQANNFITGNKDSVFTYWEFKIYPRNI
ncbi:MAG: hypothetical protein MUO34_12795 [Ignavibacteriaceae bacterium]|nr:hypothetical protein [Ignavibacteriaceae bacterium]